MRLLLAAMALVALCAWYGPDTQRREVVVRLLIGDTIRKPPPNFRPRAVGDSVLWNDGTGTRIVEQSDSTITFRVTVRR